MAGVSTYTKQVGDAICERIANGESLRKICQDKGMPTKTTVFRWLEDDNNQAFRDQYARAREWQAETLMEEAIEIADYSAQDTTTMTVGQGKHAKDIDVPDKEWIMRSKLRVDTRLKLMGQLAPKKYGPKMSLSVKDETPIQNLTDEQLLDELRKHLPNQS